MIHLTGLTVLLADAAPATAPTGPQGSPLGGMIIPMILVFAIMYFMMIRPQQQQRKQQAKLLESLKSGDRVVTSSGIVGVVITVKDKTVSLRSMDAKMEVTKPSVVEILERSGEEKSAS